MGRARRVGKNGTLSWNAGLSRCDPGPKSWLGVIPDPCHHDKTISWTKKLLGRAPSILCGRSLRELMMDEGEERVKATYGDNYQRLVEIKNKYDPDNLFG